MTKKTRKYEENYSLEQKVKRIRKYNAKFMREQLKKIHKDHELYFLIDPKTGTWKGRKHGMEVPAVQVGHGDTLSKLPSGAPERIYIEDADFNQYSNWFGETKSKGAIFKKTGVDIGGVPVERRTALMWERLGKLKKGTVENAPIHEGWIP